MVISMVIWPSGFLGHGINHRFCPATMTENSIHGTGKKKLGLLKLSGTGEVSPFLIGKLSISMGHFPWLC